MLYRVSLPSHIEPVPACTPVLKIGIQFRNRLNCQLCDKNRCPKTKPRTTTRRKPLTCAATTADKRRNTNKEIKVSYIPCSSCRMSFCHLCLRKHLQVEEPENLPEDWLCQRCNNACCCQFSFCTKDHQHCYTYRRTQQRHAQAAQKWTKKKRSGAPKGDASDDSGSAHGSGPESDSHFSPKRKKPRPSPVVKDSSNSEEEYIPDDVAYHAPKKPNLVTERPPSPPQALSPPVTDNDIPNSTETYPVLSESLHFFPLETTTILPTDFLSEKNFVLGEEGDKEEEIKEEPEISNNAGISMWDWI